MDKERLTDFAEWIRTLPSDRFSMSCFVRRGGIGIDTGPSVTGAYILQHDCGTTGCIAGWAPVWAAEQGIQSANIDSFEAFMADVFDLWECVHSLSRLIYNFPPGAPTPADAAEAILRFRDGKDPWGGRLKTTL